MTRIISYCDALREALREEMIHDKNVYLLGEDIGKWGNEFGATKGLYNEFGWEQLKDTPISEAALMGCAVGSAMMGMRPIAEIMYMDFITIAMDQMVNFAAKYHQLSNGKLNIPLVVRTQEGIGMRSSSQHSSCYENWFVNVPGLITVMPSTPYDMKGLLKSAVRSDNPIVIIEHKLLYFTKGEVPTEEYFVPLGKADIKHTGKDITIVAISWMVNQSLKAAEMLAQEGISCEVIDPRTLWPLDKETIANSVKKTKHALVVTEAPAEGGWSGEAMSVIYENCFSDLNKPVERLCGLRTGIPYGADLEKACVPDAAAIANAVKRIIKD
jgi:pyruvate/2-oxoglutarate/acetoin dehydrogenase E1 component